MDEYCFYFFSHAHIYKNYKKNYNIANISICSHMRGTSQSAAEYSLSLKKPAIINTKCWPPPKLGPPKTVPDIAFRIALTLDVKIVWFGRQVAVCVQKRHKNAIFGCSRFQKFNFDCLLLKLLIYSQTTEHIFKFVCPLLTQSSIMISGIKGYSTHFLASSHKSWHEVGNFKKNIS